MSAALKLVERAIERLIATRARLGVINHVEDALGELQVVRGLLTHAGDPLSEGQRVDARAALARLGTPGELSSDRPLVKWTVDGVNLDGRTPEEEERARIAVGALSWVDFGRVSRGQFEEAISALARIGNLGETGSDRELVRLTLQGLPVEDDHHARVASRAFIAAEES